MTVNSGKMIKSTCRLCGLPYECYSETVITVCQSCAGLALMVVNDIDPAPYRTAEQIAAFMAGLDAA